jgi:hypothetical protein
MEALEERVAALERHVEKLTEVVVTGGELLGTVPPFCPPDPAVVDVKHDLPVRSS